MNLVAREKARDLLFNAISNIIKEIESKTDDYTDVPSDMSYADYRDIGFLIQKAPNNTVPDNDLYYVGLRVGAPGSYPHDAFEVLKVGANLYLRANGKTGVLMTFTREGADKFNPNLLLVVIERALYENQDLLMAIDALDKGKKSETRKVGK